MEIYYNNLRFKEDGTLDRQHFLTLLSWSQMNQTEAFNDICDLIDGVPKISKRINLENIKKAEEVRTFHSVLSTLYTDKPAEFMAYALLNWDTISKHLSEYRNLLGGLK